FTDSPAGIELTRKGGKGEDRFTIGGDRIRVRVQLRISSPLQRSGMFIELAKSYYLAPYERNLYRDGV
ncbi:MAG TPA: hypothetical protein VFP47_15025, partial [Pyrinomonadaceae bacterium]|nr:hypothetical protein [Pyrinomonadaceae bacterium]